MRFRGAGSFLTAGHEEGQAYLGRRAPLPAALRRVSVDAAERAYDPEVLGSALGGLLRTPAPIDVRHMRAPRVTVGDRLSVLRDLLRRHSGTVSFDTVVEGADRVTVAVTVWALLELYKRGEAAWEQAEPFGPITVRATGDAIAVGGPVAVEAAA
jgi:segregation and condensation protein A